LWIRQAGVGARQERYQELDARPGRADIDFIPLLKILRGRRRAQEQ
jgi:hypothetical protein